MGVWERFTGRFRLRGVLAERVSEDATPADQNAEQIRLSRPRPTPTTRVPKRPADTPSMRHRETGESTAGTRSYGTPKGTPSTERIHNPTHFR
jgi:hypothetical protein